MNDTLMYVLQGVTGLTMAFGMFILSGIKESINKMDKKLDLCQTKEACSLSHAGHDKIHEMEREQVNKENERLQKDINNVATIARSILTPVAHSRYQE
jgi:hypothetical protein